MCGQKKERGNRRVGRILLAKESAALKTENEVGTRRGLVAID